MDFDSYIPCPAEEIVELSPALHGQTPTLESQHGRRIEHNR